MGSKEVREDEPSLTARKRASSTTAPPDSMRTRSVSDTLTVVTPSLPCRPLAAGLRSSCRPAKIRRAMPDDKPPSCGCGYEVSALDEVGRVDGSDPMRSRRTASRSPSKRRSSFSLGRSSTCLGNHRRAALAIGARRKEVRNEEARVWIGTRLSRSARRRRDRVRERPAPASAPSSCRSARFGEIKINTGDVELRRRGLRRLRRQEHRGARRTSPARTTTRARA